MKFPSFIMALIAVATLFLSGGCATKPQAKPQTEEERREYEEKLLKHARAVHASGNHMEAVKLFAYLRDNAMDERLRERALLGMSASLVGTGDTNAALGALQPLPAVPSSRFDAMRYVLSGEILMRKNSTDVAQSHLELGLSFENAKEAYRAVGSFNLGKCYLASEQPGLARERFDEARRIFIAQGNPSQAGVCARLIQDIDWMLE